MKKKYKLPLLLLALCFLLLVSYLETKIESEDTFAPKSETLITLEDIPKYDGKAYVPINNNLPDFDENDKTTESFEFYSELDNLGRCGFAFANIGEDLMPTEKRGSISSVRPSGWQSVQYDNVQGKSLYNRCHLIGFQLTAENANEKNLITGTRYLNVEGMLPFENMVADYIKETKNHVLYRITPVYEGNDLVARGVLMEAYSVEDEGEGISFKVYVYNVQPGIEIDYSNGDSYLLEEEKEGTTSKVQIEIRGNIKSKVYHTPGQIAYEDMKNSRNLIIFNSEKEARENGYRKAKK